MQTSLSPHLGNAVILTAEEWLNLPPDPSPPLIGSYQHRIVRRGTKNFIQASEKSFKTTFQLGLWLPASCGVGAFPQLPVPQPVRILYLHGELSPPEIQERVGEASGGLPRPLLNFYTGPDRAIHLCEPTGQHRLRELVGDIKPEVLVLDSWQNFIAGMDENTSKDMSRATCFLDKLIDEFGITESISIHEGKERSRGARGNSLLGAWRDTLFRLERHSDTVTVSVDPRWDKPLLPFTLEFDGDAKTLRPATKPIFTNQTMQILAFLDSQGGKATKKGVQAALHLKTEAAQKAINRARKSGAVNVAGDFVIAVQAASQGSPTPFVQT